MLVSALYGHRLWATSYDTGANPLLALESRLLQDLFRACTAKRVVDVACGTGRWSAWFADRGASVFGIDVCEEMLGQVPRRLRGRFALGRAEHLPVASNTADLTVCSMAAGYFSSLPQAFSEMARITKSGGRVVIADLHPAAVSSGWTRSFRAAGQVYEMEHSRHSLADFTIAGEAAGLHLTAEVHGCFGESERPAFEATGRPERFLQVAGVPAIWAGSWWKP